MKRHIIQAITMLATNANVSGFLQGRIYKGALKKVCVPGLNCYSCPGALGSCPIGALQAVSGSRDFSLSFYVIGFLTLFGVLLGRFVCGFLCPFGLIQELIHKIPFVRIQRPPKGWRVLKYIMLAMFVVVLPVVMTRNGIGDPAFCKYICPAGTLTGALPLLAVNEGLRRAAGGLFGFKVGVLVLVVVGCLMIYRFFCRYLCPLGVIYGFFNRISFYQLRHETGGCSGCGSCVRKCRMGVDPRVGGRDMECIRCGECVKVCKMGALQIGFKGKCRK